MIIDGPKHDEDDDDDGIRICGLPGLGGECLSIPDSLFSLSRGSFNFFTVMICTFIKSASLAVVVLLTRVTIGWFLCFVHPFLDALLTTPNNCLHILPTYLISVAII